MKKGNHIICKVKQNVNSYIQYIAMLQRRQARPGEVQVTGTQLGKFKLNILIFLYVPTLVLTPLYTYHMAVKAGQEPPYPHATITSTACHYPQDIVFRYTMLICSSILALTFYIMFRWAENCAIRVGFPPPQQYLFYLAEFSILCYGVTIGTIDGKSTGSLHGPCAVIFFVILLAVIVNLTIYMGRMRSWNTSVMSRCSLILKQLLAGYISAVWIWCIYGLVTQKSANGSDIYVVIVEWNSVTINLLWVMTMVFEWKHFNVALKTKKSLIVQ